MPKLDDVLKAKNLEFVGYWDVTFFTNNSNGGGLIVKDKSGKTQCLTWHEIRKLQNESKFKLELLRKAQ